MRRSAVWGAIESGRWPRVERDIWRIRGDLSPHFGRLLIVSRDEPTHVVMECRDVHRGVQRSVHPATRIRAQGPSVML